MRKLASTDREGGTCAGGGRNGAAFYASLRCGSWRLRIQHRRGKVSERRCCVEVAGCLVKGAAVTG